MKKVFRIILVALVISAGSIKSNEAKSQQASVNFSVFYNSLKPYGRWVNHGSYGQIWVSNTRGFRPYSTGGHWAYTDYEWTWVSDYNWGWAPFHYGRWNYESRYGWYWVPGYEWAPAWVAWRGGGDYYGWAPLSPGLSIGVGVSFGNSIPNERWVFAPHRYITSPYISRHYVSRTRNVTIIKNTTVVNNVTVRNNVNYVGGPRKDEVERINHTKIKTYTVSNSSKPGRTVVNNKTVNVYRPVINNDKTVVNNNNTTVNKNSNNTTVNKNSNNKTTNDNKTTNNTEKNTTTNNAKPDNNNQPNKPAKDASNNKPHPKKKPANNPPGNNGHTFNDNQRLKTSGEVSQSKMERRFQNRQAKQNIHRQEVAKKRNNNDPSNNN